MSQEIRQTELHAKTQGLLHGSLKHVRVAALAAALVPLASVAITQAQSGPTFSGGVVSVNAATCGFTLTVNVTGLSLSPTQVASVTYAFTTTNPGASFTGTIPVTPDSTGMFTSTVTGSFSQALSSATLINGTANLLINNVVVSSSGIQFANGPVSCTPAPSAVPSPCDFITSGGFVLTDSLPPVNRMANFGAHGGCKLGGFWGHINYIDHSSEYHVDSIQINGYLTVPNMPNGRDICGLATTNNPHDPQPVMFRVRLIDNGEPGVASMFGIRLSTGYVVTTRLLNAGMGGGGDVQLHKDNPSTVAPNPLPTEMQMCGGVSAP